MIRTFYLIYGLMPAHTSYKFKMVTLHSTVHPDMRHIFRETYFQTISKMLSLKEFVVLFSVINFNETCFEVSSTFLFSMDLHLFEFMRNSEALAKREFLFRRLEVFNKTCWPMLVCYQGNVRT